ncbi:MAG: cell division protein ZipA [Pseudomonadales bacterium]|nr:cell division protein ZipA [Pseudomonadales bacterium]
MEIGLREILILIGLFVIGVIVLDGLRRMRHSRKSSLGMSLDIGGSVDAGDSFGGELPKGGARTIDGYEMPEDRMEPSFVDTDGDYDDPLFASPAAEHNSNTAFSEESVITEENVITDESAITEDAAAVDDIGEQSEMFAESDARTDTEDRAAKVAGHYQSKLAKEQLDYPDITSRVARRVEKKPMKPKARVGRNERDTRKEGDTRKERDAGLDQALQPKQTVSEVVIINVMAKKDAEIEGRVLLQQLLNLGLRFGEMNIFHRYEKANNEGCLMFSVANVVEPGIFNLDKMDQFTTPGVCMFLSLPGPKKSMYAFDLLIDAARKVSNSLNCDMLDENHSVMTQQTIEHYRQRVLEFERRQMSRRPVLS